MLFEDMIIKDGRVQSKDVDSDFLIMYKNKLNDAIDAGDKEEIKRWSEELINQLNDTEDSKTIDITPSEYFKAPVQKTIKVKSPLDGSITTHQVIGENAVSYVVNEWYKEYNKTPQLIPKDFVIK